VSGGYLTGYTGGGDNTYNIGNYGGGVQDLAQGFKVPYDVPAGASVIVSFQVNYGTSFSHSSGIKVVGEAGGGGGPNLSDVRGSTTSPDLGVNQWYDYPITLSAGLTAGTQYYLVLDANDSEAHSSNWTCSSTGNPYANGSLWYRNPNDAGAWTALANADANFKITWAEISESESIAFSESPAILADILVAESLSLMEASDAPILTGADSIAFSEAADLSLGLIATDSLALSEAASVVNPYDMGGYIAGFTAGAENAYTLGNYGADVQVLAQGFKVSKDIPASARLQVEFQIGSLTGAFLYLTEVKLVGAGGDGKPNLADVRAGGTISLSSNMWYVKELTLSAPLTANTQYYLCLLPNGAEAKACSWVCQSTGNPYANGSLYYSNDNPISWTALANADANFRLTWEDIACADGLALSEAATAATSWGLSDAMSFGDHAVVSKSGPPIGRLRDRSRYKPAYLVEITLKNGGPTLYFSDRNINADGTLYEDYLDDLSGLGDELRRLDSSALNADITLRFKNDKYKGYNYLIEIGDTYPFEGAVCVIKETALDDSGTPSIPETVFKGALDEPSAIDLMGFTCRVSSMPYVKDRAWKQAVIDTTTYPNAYEDVGKVEPVVYGSNIRIPAHRIDWGAKTTLKAALADGALASIELSDASRFPSSGAVWIDDEKLSYTGKSGNTLSGVSRAQGGTTATAHRAGAEVWEHKTQYDSLLAGHELHSIGDIFAEIDGKLLRVTEGVSAVFEGGKHKLRATSQIKTESVLVVKGLHHHNVASTMRFLPTSAGAGGDYSGSPDAVIDQSEATYCQLSASGTSPDSFSLSANFPTYNGPQPSAVYFCVQHSSMNIDYSGGTCTLQVRAFNPYTNQSVLHNLVMTGAFVTQKFLWGNSVPLPLSITVFGSTGGYYDHPASINAKIYEIWMEVQSTDSGDSPATGVSGIDTRNVDRFHAVVSGHKDPDGNYGGIGELIRRPDLVIKHFLVQKMGFSLDDIDGISFNSSGTAYANTFVSGGYKLDCVIGQKIRPSEFLKRLAYELRSTVSYEKGKWYLHGLPDSAPPALRTITKSELAGEGSKFIFSKTPITDIVNDLTARFKKAYSRLGSESDWDGTAKASDSASITKYGSYPKELEFEAIREQAMADNVLAYILKQGKQPYLVVEFPVFYDHFDLTVGDTIEIDNPLYDGKKFFIEEIKREDKFRAIVRAVEWW